MMFLIILIFHTAHSSRKDMEISFRSLKKEWKWKCWKEECLDHNAQFDFYFLSKTFPRNWIEHGDVNLI